MVKHPQKRSKKSASSFISQNSTVSSVIWMTVRHTTKKQEADYSGDSKSSKRCHVKNPRDLQTSFIVSNFRMFTRSVEFKLSLFGPTGLKTEVKSVEIHHKALQETLPDDSLGFNVKNVVVKNLKHAFVVSNSKDDPAKAWKKTSKHASRA